MTTIEKLLKQKNDAYAAAKKENQKAVDDYIKSLTNAYNAQKSSATAKAAAQKASLTGKYQGEYDLNQINKLISERKLAERMSNLGLSNSGLNASQLAALSVAKQNSDNATSIKKASDIRSIDALLNSTLSDLNIEKSQKTAAAEKTMHEKNADALTKLNNAYTSAVAALKKSGSSASSKAKSSQNFMNAYSKLSSLKTKKSQSMYLAAAVASGYITKTQYNQLAKIINTKGAN